MPHRILTWRDSVTVFYLWAGVDMHESAESAKGREYLEYPSEFKFLCSLKFVTGVR
jgi:hypothetical protein